jgi:hypothetical protein
MLATLLWLVSIPAIFFLYSHFAREWREIDPVLLEHQTSIGETRKACESATYRSVDVPHGMQVTRGLSLRNGYKIRDGCLKDIWHLALSNRDETMKPTRVSLGEKTFTIGQVNSALHRIAQRLEKYQKIAVYGKLNENPELLLVVWSCFFVLDKVVLVYENGYDLSLVDSEDESLAIITTDRYSKDAPPAIFGTVIGVEFVNDSDLEDSVSSAFSDIIQIEGDIKPSMSYEYDPNKDFANVNNHSYSLVKNGKETKFFQVNFVSSVASKLLSVPRSYSWNASDRVVISYNDSSFTSNNIIFQSLCALMSNVEAINIVNPDMLTKLSDIEKFNSTILCIDSHTLRDICTSTKKSFWQSFKLQRGEYFNSLGYFTKFGQLNHSLNLKLTYVTQLEPGLSSFICNFCKTVLGSRITREVFTDFTMGPILKTNLFDYRVVETRSLALLGVPANSVELKILKDSEEAKQGRLFVRGMSVGKGDHSVMDDDFWIDSGIEGTFARDGCFYGRL